jgi:hypothetical protein
MSSYKQGVFGDKKTRNMADTGWGRAFIGLVFLFFSLGAWGKCLPSYGHYHESAMITVFNLIFRTYIDVFPLLITQIVPPIQAVSQISLCEYQNVACRVQFRCSQWTRLDIVSQNIEIFTRRVLHSLRSSLQRDRQFSGGRFNSCSVNQQLHLSPLPTHLLQSDHTQ